MIDLFSRRILSWSTSTSHDTEFVEEALRLALWQRCHGSGSRKSPIQSTIHDSDVGSEYTSQRYT
ncbi:DDE-type integrase/transposase/recombinase [Glutamicibacter halophytocola]|uniref:DDE-type integrase/transposase/recombinase n=1 Tax=Glutamicibacter halophytocola TaxID=1933880 RepID=UPI003D2C874D